MTTTHFDKLGKALVSRWNGYQNKIIFIQQQGKSEGFVNCDQPSNLQIIDFSASVTLKFDGWSEKTIGHLF